MTNDPPIHSSLADSLKEIMRLSGTPAPGNAGLVYEIAEDALEQLQQHPTPERDGLAECKCQRLALPLGSVVMKGLTHHCITCGGIVRQHQGERPAGDVMDMNGFIEAISKKAYSWRFQYDRDGEYPSDREAFVMHVKEHILPRFMATQTSEILDNGIDRGSARDGMQQTSSPALATDEAKAETPEGVSRSGPSGGITGHQPSHLSQQPDELSLQIYRALNGHKLLHHTIRDSDCRLPLIDLLTPFGNTNISAGLEETAALAEEIAEAITLPERERPDQVATKLWLWKNFVDGRPEYWAFNNPYPCHPNGDPMTLGEPCGYAILKPSISGRPESVTCYYCGASEGHPHSQCCQDYPTQICTREHIEESHPMGEL